MVHVKICGVRTVDDALAAVRLGASAVGLNFIDASPRRVDVARAREISAAVRGTGARVLLVGVVADESVEAMRGLVHDAALDCLQLHGDESPETVAALLPHVYKAVRVATVDDVARARSFPGDHLLVDAKVEGALGGTGETFDWDLVRGLSEERRLTLAGGLRPDNVAAAIRAVRPFCVDVASGVERAPGEKDEPKMRAFIAAARAAGT